MARVTHHFPCLVDAVGARVVAPSGQEAKIGHRAVAKKSGMATAAVHGIILRIAHDLAGIVDPDAIASVTTGDGAKILRHAIGEANCMDVRSPIGMARDLARIVDSRRMADRLASLAGDHAKIGEMVSLRLRARPRDPQDRENQ